MRPTKNQRRVLALLEKIRGEISAQQLYLQLREQNCQIGLATVYRVLKALHIDGVVQERVGSNGESFYSLISKEHHHHLNCLNCGQSIVIENCPLNHGLNQWCQEQKFQVYYHTLELFGLCHSCQQEQN